MKEEQNRIGNTEEIEVEREKIKNEEREIEMKSNLRQGKKNTEKVAEEKKDINKNTRKPKDGKMEYTVTMYIV